MDPNCQPLQLWGGVECTINRVGDRYHNQLRRNGHWNRIDDLDRIAALGIRTVRQPLLWESLAERAAGPVDWSWPDARMRRLQELGIRPIVGLVHHGSGPRDTGPADPRFPELLARYARRIAERYPWVEDWTPVNEPLTTARFSGLYGHWFPHGRNGATFARALLMQLRGVALAMRAIREVVPSARLVQTEDLGEVFSTPALRYQAEFENERRWLSVDLLTGRLPKDGPVWSYLRHIGVGERELAPFFEHPCPPDVIGVNHYITSGRYLDENLERHPACMPGGNGRHVYVDVEAVRGRPEGLVEPESLLRQAWARYGRPIAVTEAHLSCTREEQMRWLHEIWTAAERVRSDGIPVIAVTAWSLFGAFDWDSLLTENNGRYEPGAFDLRGGTPRPTALAAMLRGLAEKGMYHHPVLDLPGWWRRSVRFLPAGGDDPAERNALRPSFFLLPAPARGKSALRPPLLITGATGTLGQAFARVCYLRGLPYRLLTRAEMDIADPAAVQAAMEAVRPWAVINAAGYVRVDDAETDRDRCLRENAAGPATLAEACAERGVRLVCFSSDLVFSGEKEGCHVESDPVSPLNVYGWSKAAAEERVAAICPEALILRTSAFFGPWDAHNFVTRTIERVRSGAPVVALEDSWVTPTYVPDLAHAALDLLIDGESGLWHAANQGAVTWAEFGRLAARLSGGDDALVEGCACREMSLPARRPRNSALGSERAHLLPPYEEALERYFMEHCGTTAPTDDRFPGILV